jgi:cytochrome P450
MNTGASIKERKPANRTPASRPGAASPVAGPVTPLRELGYPLVGHVPAFRKDRLALLKACAATPGDVIEVRLGRSAYLLKRAQDVQHVLVAGHAMYPKGPRNIGARATRIFGDGLMTNTGEAHRRMRRRVQPVFRRQPIERAAETILRGIDAMIDRWEKAPEIDLADETNRLALKTLIGSIFGVESRSSISALEEGMLARCHSMSRAFAWPVTAPGFLPIAVVPRHRRAIARLDEILYGLIQEQRDRATASDDLLSMMMETYEGGRSAADARQVHDEALNLLLAAHGNVARVLAYALLALAGHVHVEAKLREEVERVLGGRAPTADDCSKLRYTEMTVAETMRLWPPSPLVFRVARQDDVLPSGARIRAGSKLLLSPYVVQRDPAYYPDPERFDPERFSAEGRSGRPKYAYFPFGGGPRVCIGQTLASLVSTLVLARTAQRVRLELAGDPPSFVCGPLPPGSLPTTRVRSLARTAVRVGTPSPS